MRKKVISMLVLSTLMITVLGGCGQSVSEEIVDNSLVAEEAGRIVNLTVWAEADNFAMTEDMIESFKAEYAGEAEFEITLAAQTDATTKDNFLADIHNGADVMSIPDDQLLGLIAAGAISPVPNGDEVKAANLEESVEAASYNDILYAYPYTADNGYFLYYDKDYFTEEDVKTMDGILAVCEAAGKRFSMEFNSGWYLYTFFGGTGMEFGLNDDGITNYCTWNATEGKVKGADIVDALYTITSSPGFVAQSDDLFQEGVQNGNVIAGISGVWNAILVRDSWGEDYGACKLPTYTCAGEQIQMYSFTGYKMMAVNSYSENVEWAHKLADWLTNEENQTIRFEVRNQGPSNNKAAASDAVMEVPAIAAVIDQSQYGNLQRVGNLYWDACTNFAESILAGNPEGKSNQALIDTMVTGITSSTVQ